MSLYVSMDEYLSECKTRGMLRTIVPKAQEGIVISEDKHHFVNLSGNDYLGLASDSALNEEFLDSLKSIKPGLRRLSSSGSPLLSGAHESYGKVATLLRAYYGKEMVAFTSGFAANSGVLRALGEIKHTLIVADRYIHASMIDGILASKCRFIRYPHNDYAALSQILAREHEYYQNIIIVSEATFSMDGDHADLEKLVALKSRYKNCYLYIDEAHAFTVVGENGLGLCAEGNVIDKCDFILLTFGKGLGSEGAVLMCSAVAKEYFINTVRTLIFSTALSPITFLHQAFMLEKLPTFIGRRQRLYKISSYIQETIQECGFLNLSESQIIPLLAYENENAIRAAVFFKEKGFYALPIRYPTVPRNSARLRLSLSAGLNDLQVENLHDCIIEFYKTIGKCGE